MTAGRRLVDAASSLGLTAADVRAGRALVNGFPATNPQRRLRPGDVVTARRDEPLRGEAKLRAGLLAFGVDVAGRTCLDVGAAAGGFTSVLLERGAGRVYAVDAGHGQLVGSLRQDPRVVNLEATNLGDLDRRLVPEPVQVVTVDVSYLSLADALPQLRRVDLAPGCDLVALVKPMFELHLAEPPDPADEAAHAEACRLVQQAASIHGWLPVGLVASPVSGSRGAREHLLHARLPEGVSEG